MVKRFWLSLTSVGSVLLFLPALVSLCGVAHAGDASGVVEYQFTKSLSETSDKITGTKEKTKSDSLSQQYILGLTHQLMPQLNLTASSNIQIDDTWSETSGQKSTNHTESYYTNAEIAQNSEMLASGFGYSRRSDYPGSTIVDLYNGRISYRPADLPTLSLIGSRTHSYDKDRSKMDNQSDSLTISSNYSPVKELTLNYSANLEQGEFRSQGSTSDSSRQSLRLSYGDRFFNGRIAVDGDSSFTYSTIGAATKPGGTLPDQQITSDSWKQATTDFNSIVVPPLVSYGSGDIGDLGPQHQGNPSSISPVIPLFATGTSTTSLVTTQVAANLGVSQRPTVIRVLLGTSAELDKLADPNNSTVTGVRTALDTFFRSGDRFSGVNWFVSEDGTSWSAAPTPTVSGLTPDETRGPNGEIRYYYKYTFPTPVGRYVMLWMRPKVLDSFIPGIDQTFLSKLNVAGLSLFTAAPSGATSSSSSSMSDAHSLNVRIRLTEKPLLTFDSSMQLSHTKNDTAGEKISWSITNGLNISHQFSKKLQGSGRLARSDNESAGKRDSSNAWALSLTYTPIEALRHLVSYSGRTSDSNGDKSSNHAVNMMNSFALYRGISLSLNGTASLANAADGAKNVSTTVQGGMSIEPHPRLTLGLSQSLSNSKTTGGGRVDSLNTTQQSAAQINLRPFDALFIQGDYAQIKQTGQKTLTTTSIGGGWSPLRGGALLLSLNYRESITSSATKERSANGSLHLEIRQGTTLDVGVNQMWGESGTQNITSTNFTTSLRIVI